MNGTLERFRTQEFENNNNQQRIKVHNSGGHAGWASKGIGRGWIGQSQRGGSLVYLRF